MGVFGMHRGLRILQISTVDGGGGSEKMAWGFHQALRAKGNQAWMAVGHKNTEDQDVLVIPKGRCRTMWARTWLAVGNMVSGLVGKVRGAVRLYNLVYWIGQPKRWLGTRLGHENFDFPGTWKILELPPERPDIVHCCNLHGNYFDLRVLPWLSRQVPVVMKPGDMWLLTGHCAHSLDCERWKSGCGHCPRIDIYPAIRRDATAFNWQRKRQIYARSRLYFATRCRWLTDIMEQSILAPAITETRVIPNGIDLAVFHPGDRNGARTMLGIPHDAKVLLFVGKAIRSNIFKDYQTLEAAVEQVADRLPGVSLLLICLGEKKQPEHIGGATVWSVGYQNDTGTVAEYYRAADIYVHAARADTFPNTVLEALACGTPVVATAVGGIPDQIEDGVTGFLVSRGDASHMAERIERLLHDTELQKRMGLCAAESARHRFDLNRQVDAYLEWYYEILADWHGEKRGAGNTATMMPH